MNRREITVEMAKFVLFGAWPAGISPIRWETIVKFICC